jgi:hypothetical protein
MSIGRWGRVLNGFKPSLEAGKSQACLVVCHRMVGGCERRDCTENNSFGTLLEKSDFDRLKARLFVWAWGRWVSR